MNADGIMGLLFDTMAAQGKQLLPDDDQSLLERALQYGSGHSGSKVRIRVAVKKWGRDIKRLKAFLVDEYGVGGHSWENGTFVDYNGSGIKITFFYENLKPLKYSWEKVARTLVKMEDESRLYDVKTMQEMYAIFQRCTGYPEPIPRFQYPPEVRKQWG